MKAIQVRYLPTTNTRGTRWKAFAEGGAVNDFETYLRNLSDRELDLLWRDYCSENAKYHNLERASAIHAETERRRPMEYYDGDGP